MADGDPGHSVHHQWEMTAFVLGDLGGQQRAAMVAHLEHCAGCQAEIASLTDTLADLTALIPPMTPSPGFVNAVMEALPVDPLERSMVTEGPTAVRRRRSHGMRSPKVWALTAVAALLAAALGIGLTTQTTSGGRTSSNPSPVVAEMRTTTGTGVGQAVVFDQRRALVSVALDIPPGTRWSPGGPYKVLVIQRDGSSTTLGNLVVTRGEGGLQVRTSIPATAIATVRVVAPNGQSLCAGLISFPSGPGASTGV